MCFFHFKLSPIFWHQIIVLLLIVNLILGLKRIRVIDYYREDLMILGLMGFKKQLDVTTISGSLVFFDIHHLPGNVYDSNGAAGFMQDCFYQVRALVSGSIL